MNVQAVFKTLLCLLMLVFLCGSTQADVKLNSMFGDHMVLQRDQAIIVWGTGSKAEEVTVSIGKNTATAIAKVDDNANYSWKVELEPMPAGGPHQLVIKGNNTITFEDVMIGEVWICSGQSNMQWPVSASYDQDLELLKAKNPNLRLISVPQVGTQTPQEDFQGAWEVAEPNNVASFSAVGYYFGSRLQQTLGVPVGLIDNAWGGSAAEAWVKRSTLEKSGKFDPLLEKWDTLAANYDHEAAMAKYNERLKKWQAAIKEAKASGKAAPPRPRAPRNQLAGQHRPANIYNGVLKPTIGYGIRGVIWYQGESNSGRAYQYRELFPLMIQSWRDEWGQGDFPFYWVQLADFRNEIDMPGESTWAELREAQTMSQKLPNTGQAVIIDIGEGNDIHPREKFDVARRLARIALAKDYGYELVHRSPEYKSIEFKAGKAIVTFDTFGSALDTFDVSAPKSFAIAGEDKKFVWANAKILAKDKIEVSSDQVKQPAAVRYAWADNPVVNLLNTQGLPVTPFRTDDWKGLTAGVEK